MRFSNLLIAMLVSAVAFAADKYVTTSDVCYLLNDTNDSYKLERSFLDIYAPENAENMNLPVVIFFHGGGLEGGSKHIPNVLKEQGVIVVAPNYRLSPKVNAPKYIEDAAEAVAWTVRHIAEYGGDPNKIFVSGHSAGGYLTLMLALDKSYLGKYGVDADALAGYAPLSGQTATHYTIRQEMGVDKELPLVDKYAPLNNARKLVPPMILVTGGRELEMSTRYIENVYMQEVLKLKGANVPMYELDGFNHGTMLDPGCLLLLEMVKRHK